MEASLINKSDTDVVEFISGVGLTAKKWDNTFPSTALDNLFDAVSANSVERPILVHTSVGGIDRPEVSFQEDLSKYWGRALGSRAGSTAKMLISDIDTEVDVASGTSKRFDMLVVMRRVTSPAAPYTAGEPVIKGGDGLNPVENGWALSWVTADKLELKAADSTTSCAVDFSIPENEWYLVSLTAESDADPVTPGNCIMICTI